VTVGIKTFTSDPGLGQVWARGLGFSVQRFGVQGSGLGVQAGLLFLWGLLCGMFTPLNFVNDKSEAKNKERVIQLGLSLFLRIFSRQDGRNASMSSTFVFS